MMSDIHTIEELDAVLHWRNKHAIAIKERDALQLLLSAADQRVDELGVAESERTALREELSQRPSEVAMSLRLKNHDLQQRIADVKLELTVVEQRNMELFDLLRDLLPYLSDWTNPHRSAMRTRVDAAIKNTDAGMSASKPAAWANTSDLAAIAAGGLWSGTLWGGKNHPSFEPRLPLYASPPAPVAVVLPERQSRKESFECGGIAQEQFSMGWNACLDKVKQLNT